MATSRLVYISALPSRMPCRLQKLATAAYFVGGSWRTDSAEVVKEIESELGSELPPPRKKKEQPPKLTEQFLTNGLGHKLDKVDLRGRVNGKEGKVYVGDGFALWQPKKKKKDEGLRFVDVEKPSGRKKKGKSESIFVTRPRWPTVDMLEVFDSDEDFETEEVVDEDVISLKRRRFRPSRNIPGMPKWDLFPGDKPKKKEDGDEADANVVEHLASDSNTAVAVSDGNLRAVISSGMPDAELKCQHFSRCSGCVLEKALHDPPVMKDATSFFRRRGVEDFSLETNRVWGWRCRAKLAVRGTPEEPLIGLFEDNSHEITDIPVCRAHHPSLNVAVEILKDAIRELGIQPYDETSCTGELRYIQLVLSTYVTRLPSAERYANGRVQVSLVWNCHEENFATTQLRRLSEVLWAKAGKDGESHLIHSVWANFQPSQTNVIFGEKWKLLAGESELWERQGGVDVCYMPASFGQANYEAYEAMLKRMRRYVKKRSRVVELFAGVGVIGLSLAAAKSLRFLKCVERNKDSQEPFRRTLACFPRRKELEISWHHADASKNPIKWIEGCDVVIADPPRKGLPPSVIEALRVASFRAQGKMRSPPVRKERRPWVLRAQAALAQDVQVLKDDAERPAQLKKFIYISCGWKAFKEDCRALEQDGAWHLEDGCAFNFFPGTDSIEVVGVFAVGKNPSGKKVKKKSVHGEKGR